MSNTSKHRTSGSRTRRKQAAAFSWESPREVALQLYHAGPMQKVELVREGIPASYVAELSRDMGISREKLYATAGLPRATIDRKLGRGARLSRDESECIAGIGQLIGQAQAIVSQSGGGKGFDAPSWVAQWLDQPHPALGGRRPGEFMDTSYGRGLVGDLLAQQQSGAYA